MGFLFINFYRLKDISNSGHVMSEREELMISPSFLECVKGDETYEFDVVNLRCLWGIKMEKHSTWLDVYVKHLRMLS